MSSLTVKELIAKLEGMNPNAPVVIGESHSDIGHVGQCEIAEFPFDMGRDMASQAPIANPEKFRPKVFSAVLIARHPPKKGKEQDNAQSEARPPKGRKEDLCPVLLGQQVLHGTH